MLAGCMSPWVSVRGSLLGRLAQRRRGRGRVRVAPPRPAWSGVRDLKRAEAASARSDDYCSWSMCAASNAQAQPGAGAAAALHGRGPA